MNRTRIFQIVIILLMGARLFLALPVFASPDRAIFTDSIQYLKLADSLRLSGQYAGTEWEVKMRPPGYPLFLAAIRAIAPTHLGLVSLLQILITCGTAYLIYGSGKALGGERVGLAGALMYALNPNALFWSLSILTETLFAFLLVFSFYLLIQARQQEKLYLLAGSGLLLSFAVLVRPIGLLLLPIWTVFVALMYHPVRFKQSLLRVVVFLVAAYFLVFAWQVRNYLMDGRFYFSASAGETFEGYISADTLGDALAIDRESAKTLIAQQPDPEAYSLRVPFLYPLSFLKVTLIGEARTWMGVEAGTWLKLVTDLPYQGSGFLGSLAHGDIAEAWQTLSSRLSDPGQWASLILILWGMLYTLVLYALVIVGLLRLLRCHRAEVRWLAGLALVSALYLLLAPLGDGDARFRVPGEPLLAILAGLASIKVGQVVEEAPVLTVSSQESN